MPIGVAGFGRRALWVPGLGISCRCVIFEYVNIELGGWIEFNKYVTSSSIEFNKYVDIELAWLESHRSELPT